MLIVLWNKRLCLQERFICIVQQNKKGKLFMRIAIDAMGDDHAPEERVLGAREAIQQIDNLQITLIGNEEKLKGFLTDDKNIYVIQPTQKITFEDESDRAYRRQKDSPLVLMTN